MFTLAWPSRSDTAHAWCAAALGGETTEIHVHDVRHGRTRYMSAVDVTAADWAHAEMVIALAGLAAERHAGFGTAAEDSGHDLDVAVRASRYFDPDSGAAYRDAKRKATTASERAHVGWGRRIRPHLRGPALHIDRDPGCHGRRPRATPASPAGASGATLASRAVASAQWTWRGRRRSSQSSK